MENFQNFLKYMDIFGMKFHFYIDKKKKYYSILGGVLSISALIISLGIFIFACLKRLNPSITSIIYSDSHNIFEKDRIFIAWKITDENNNSINYSNLTIEYYSEEEDKDNIKSINYKFCNQTSIINNKAHYFKRRHRRTPMTINTKDESKLLCHVLKLLRQLLFFFH